MLPKIKHNWLVELGLESLASLTSAWILSDGALMALCSLSKSLEASEIFQRHMDVKGWNVKGQIKCLFSSSDGPPLYLHNGKKTTLPPSGSSECDLQSSSS